MADFKSQASFDNEKQIAMEVSIIIVNYNMRGLVKNCLKSVLESQFSLPYEIIVVDNNSGDQVEEMLK